MGVIDRSIISPQLSSVVSPSARIAMLRRFIYAHKDGKAVTDFQKYFEKRILPLFTNDHEKVEVRRVRDEDSMRLRKFYDEMAGVPEESRQEKKGKLLDALEKEILGRKEGSAIGHEVALKTTDVQGAPALVSADTVQPAPLVSKVPESTQEEAVYMEIMARLLISPYRINCSTFDSDTAKSEITKLVANLTLNSELREGFAEWFCIKFAKHIPEADIPF